MNMSCHMIYLGYKYEPWALSSYPTLIDIATRNSSNSWILFYFICLCYMLYLAIGSQHKLNTVCDNQLLMMRPFTYTNESLFAIRKSVINTIHDKIDCSTWMTLKELDIAKRTERGCSAGVNKQRPIKTIISDRMIDQRFA